MNFENSSEKKFLFVGCSKDSQHLPQRLYDDGMIQITNVDSSKPLIRELLTANMRARPKMKWQVVDFPLSSIPDSAFDIVFLNAERVEEIGLELASIASPIPRPALPSLQILEEAKRVAGEQVICCVSANSSGSFDESFVTKWLERWANYFGVGWKITLSSQDAAAGGNALLLFISKKEPIAEDGKSSQIDISPSFSHPSPAIASFVATENEERRNNNKLALSDSFGLSQIALAADFEQIHPGRQLKILLSEESGSRPKRNRFWMTVVDAPAEKLALCQVLCAVFVVPRGRENEWLYSNSEGMEQVRSAASASRLLVVEMIREEDYGSLKSVQVELNAHVVKFVQVAARERIADINYMTTDDGLGNRWKIASAVSDMQGEIVVEDVQVHGTQRARRMVFISNKNLIQSEISLLKKSKPKAKTEVWEPSFDKLAFSYHSKIVKIARSHLSSGQQGGEGGGAAAAAAAAGGGGGGGEGLRSLVIGLGGGPLSMHLAHVMKMSAVVAVELDPVVVQLAKRHFGVDEKVEVVVGDGLVYAREHRARCEHDARQKFDLIVVDAGSSDPSLTMSCPPAPFFVPDFLANCRGILSEGGLLAVNCVTRSTAAFDAAMATLSASFPHSSFMRIKGDVNRLVLASDRPVRISSKTSSEAK